MMETIRDWNHRRAVKIAEMGNRWRALPKWQRVLAYIAAIIAAYGMPWFGKIPGTDLVIPGLYALRTDSIANGNSWSGVLFTCAIYILIAIGLNVVVGLAGLLDLGYIGFFAVGAYSVALFGSRQSPVVQAIQAQFGLSETWSMAWAMCIPLAILLTMISGVLLGWPTLRLRGDYLAIVTLGFGEIIRIVVRNVGWSGGPSGVAGIPGPQGVPSADNNVFGLIDPKPWYWLALTVALIAVFAVRRLENSRVGRAWLAIREDEDAAAVMGVYGFKYKLWAFAIGAALGGMSGFLFASRYTFIEPNQFNALLSILFVAAVVVGGAGNMAGVALGAFLLAYLPERFRDFNDYRFLVFGLALVLIMLLRPQGILPSRRRARELKDRKEEVPANG